MFGVHGIAVGPRIPLALICLMGGIIDDRDATAGPAEASPHGNPAEAYVRAYQQLTELDDERTHQLGACNAAGCWVVTTPLDAATTDFITKLNSPAELTRRAATSESTLWPTSVDRIQRARIVRTLSGMLTLSSRKAYAENRHEEGIQDLIRALAIARHGAGDANFFAKAIEIGAARPPREVLATQLPRLPRSLVEDLPQQLAALPNSPSMAQVLMGEHQWGLQDAATKGPFMSQAFKALEPLFRRLADDASLPPSAFSALMDKELAGYRENFLAAALAPVIGRIRESVAAAEASEALLNAGIRIVLEGPSVIDEMDDPFGDGPIHFEPTEDGFELSSQLLYRDRPVTLQFGPKK